MEACKRLPLFKFPDVKNNPIQHLYIRHMKNELLSNIR
jgi:hypothetical protein